MNISVCCGVKTSEGGRCSNCDEFNGVILTQKIYKTPQCHYCNIPAELVKGNVIYPHRSDLFDKNFWYCENCGAYVGCHNGSKLQKGFLANTELRKLRIECHRLFDKTWSNKKERDKNYRKLGKSMGINHKQLHFGYSNEKECKAAIFIMKHTDLINQQRRND